jgi:hypothetical protein
MEDRRITARLRSEIDKLLELTEDYQRRDVPVHEMERGILSALVRLGYELLRELILYKISTWCSVKLYAECGRCLERKGFVSRQYVSLFGEMSISRPCYRALNGSNIYYADERLCLPQSKWSYTLQELTAESASDADYAESVRVINKILDLGLSAKFSQRNADYLGGLVEGYYENRQVASETEVGSCYALYFDGKGVPKVKHKAISESDEVPKDNPEAGKQAKKYAGYTLKQRAGKGGRPNVMQMATVVVASHFVPKKRTAQRIIKGLMYKPLAKKQLKKASSEVPETNKDKENDNRWHKGIHRRAFMGDQQKAVDYGLQHIRDQIKKSGGRFVVPIDAGIGLEDKVMAGVKKYGLEPFFDGIILDIVHVIEYVWDAANAIWGENSTARYEWVQAIMLDLLEGKTSKAIENIQQSATENNLSQGRSTQVNRTINYFNNHQHKMNYHIFLEKGYPVSSALVEAACGHLVKDRMEQSGMRWSTAGAQRMLDIRAIKQNNDMQQFIDFVIKQEHQQAFKTAA